MRKQPATVGLAATLVAGGAGALALLGPGVSSAQEATTETTAAVTERITAMVNGERPEGAPDGGLHNRMQERFGS